MNDNGSASVPAIKQFLKSAESCGVQCSPLLEQAGIDQDLLLDNNRRVPRANMERLLALLIAASGDPCFGLLTARFIEPASYSVTGYVSMNCSSLREVLAKIPVYEKIVGDMGVSTTTVIEGAVLQSWVCQFQDPEVKHHQTENVIASWYNYARDFLHFDTSLSHSIWFEHPAPSNPALLSSYEKTFACEVLFEQAANGILFPAELLDQPIPQADEKLLATLLEHASRVLEEIQPTLTVAEQVKNQLRLRLQKGVPSSAVIAGKLGMSSRTLQRKLNDENTRYQHVLQDLRLELALHYISNTRLSMDSIAQELGYTEPRSFYRSFKQWTGRTASSYRDT